jgi:hypothetical protein
MIIDLLTSLSSEQVVTATAPTEDHMNIAGAGHIGAAADINRALGTGRPLYVAVVLRDVAGVIAADTSIQFDLQTDEDDAFGSPTTVVSSRTLTGDTEIFSGQKLVLSIPPGVVLESFLRGNYTVVVGTGGSPSVTVDAFITDDQTFDHTTYPDATEGVTV